MKRYLSLFLCFVLVLTAIAVPVQAKNKNKNKNKTKTTSTKNTFNAKKAKKKIKVTYQQTSEGMLVVFKNNNTYAVCMTAEFKFKDASGNSLLDEEVKNLCFGKKKTMAYFFRGPVDDEGHFVNYASYECNISVEKTTYKDYTSKIQVTPQIEPTLCNFMTINASTKELTSIFATVVFYDAAGNITFIKNQYFNCNQPTSATNVTVEYGGYLAPSSVKTYVNWAY